MMIVAKAGKIALNIYPDKIDEKNFIGFSDSPPSEERMVTFDIYFKRVTKKDLVFRKAPDDFRDAMEEYYWHHFRGLNTFEKDITFTDSAFLFGRTKTLYNLFKRNRRRLINDFLIFNLHDRFFIVADSKNKKSTLFYSDLLSHKYAKSSFQSVIRFLFLILSGLTSSFFLHCSALLINNKGYLFVGESGTGKSTIARIILNNIKSSKIVSDDMVCITAQDKSFFACKIDECSKPKVFRIAKNRKLELIKIHNIFLIAKAKLPSIKHIKSFEALSEILSTHIINPPIFKRLFAASAFSAMKMIKKIKPKRLFFAKDKAFIRLLT